jgi:hypothetical protein
MEGCTILALIFSDTHGRWKTMIEPVRLHKPDWVFHLGDDHSDARRLAAVCSGLRFCSVAGNCDWNVPVGTSAALDWEGTRIYLCHGHLHGVKKGLKVLAAAAKGMSAQIAFYGHTHIAADVLLGGIRLINPGSPVCPRAGLPGYGVLESGSNGTVSFRHVTIP